MYVWGGPRATSEESLVLGVRAGSQSLPFPVVIRKLELFILFGERRDKLPGIQ